MCNLTGNSITDDDFCEKQLLQWKLQKLRTSETYTAINGQTYVWVRFIENLEKELECSI